jgi:hypothetical protein
MKIERTKKGTVINAGSRREAVRLAYMVALTGGRVVLNGEDMTETFLGDGLTGTEIVEIRQTAETGAHQISGAAETGALRVSGTGRLTAELRPPRGRIETDAHAVSHVAETHEQRFERVHRGTKLREL